MATFFNTVLNREPIFFVSSFDPNIDWITTEANGLTREKYKEDPFSNVHRLVKVDDKQDFIKIELMPPRQVDTLVAFDLAGISVDEKGEMLFANSDQLSSRMRTVVSSSLARPQLALLCTYDCFNLDNWPKPCREPFVGNVHRLTEDAALCLPDAILDEVGLICQRMDEMGKLSGLASEVLPSGESSNDGTSIPTSALSVEIPKSEDSGVVTGARSRQDPEEMTA